jgi:NAD+ diphosphatase
VTQIRPSRANFYTASPLDRANHRRDDDTWIGNALHAPASQFVPVWRAHNLMRGVEQARPEAMILTGAVAAQLRASIESADLPWVFLGIRDEAAVFAVDVSAHDEPLRLLGAESGSFTDLRAVAGALPTADAAILAHARGLVHWRGQHHYCGVCGGVCVPASAGHVVRCTGCETIHFPRTDPAVIMLVHRGDHALLGHSRRFPNVAMYSTLAGFVEPGESLEEAVAREVGEEAGVRVGRVDYHSSQPWPFPASIMLGFYAEAVSEEVTIDPNELEDARWFSRDEILNPQAHGFALPRLDSIARRLIEDWVAA